MRLFFSLGEQFSKACVGIKEKIIPYFVKISLVGAGIALRGRFFCAEPGIFSFAGSTSGAGGAEREKKARKKQEVLFCSRAVRCRRGGKGEESKKRPGSSLLPPYLPLSAGRKGRRSKKKSGNSLLESQPSRQFAEALPAGPAPSKAGENISHVPTLPRLLRTRRKASCPGPLSSPSRPCRPSGHRCRGRSPRFRRRKAGCRPGRTGPRGSS